MWPLVILVDYVFPLKLIPTTSWAGQRRIVSKYLSGIELHRSWCKELYLPAKHENHTFVHNLNCFSFQVEVYLDLACSDCAMAWPVMLEVAEEYGQQAEFLFRLFPLPYHRTAFVAAQVSERAR